MNRYEVMTTLGREIEVEAEHYDIREDGLDFIKYDDEGSEDYVATFKNWEYVRKI